MQKKKFNTIYINAQLMEESEFLKSQLLLNRQCYYHYYQGVCVYIYTYICVV